MWLIPGGTTDGELVIALSSCYEYLCANKYSSGILTCPLNLDDVSGVIISYIAYFSMDENKDAKYYYDEYSDRKDPYRVGLVALITKGALEYSKNITAELTNAVLSYLYWSIKRGTCPKLILRPKGELKFREKNWYIKEPYRSIISMNASVYNAMVRVFRLSKRAVEVVIGGVEMVLDLTSQIQAQLVVRI